MAIAKALSVVLEAMSYFTLLLIFVDLNIETHIFGLKLNS